MGALYSGFFIVLGLAWSCFPKASLVPGGQGRHRAAPLLSELAFCTTGPLRLALEDGRGKGLLAGLHVLALPDL